MTASGSRPGVGTTVPGLRPTVGVVIPSSGRRASLTRAVRSALAQTVPVDRVVVVVDGPVELLEDIPLPADDRLVVTSCRPASGGNAARTAGIARLDTDLVALLDDDDEWLPDKIERQLEVYTRVRQDGGGPVVVACRAIGVDPEGTPRRVFPHRLLRPDQSIADYLFARHHVRFEGGKIASSMLLFDREVVEEVPLEMLPRHQDWDWLLRVDVARAARFVIAPQALVRYTHQPATASIAVSTGWQNSRDWAALRADLLSPREHADFLLCVTAPIAMTHGDWRGVGQLLREVARLRDGGPQAWAWFGAHVLLSAQRQLRARLRALTGR